MEVSSTGAALLRALGPHFEKQLQVQLAPAVQWLMSMVTQIPLEASETVQELCGPLGSKQIGGSSSSSPVFAHDVSFEMGIEVLAGYAAGGSEGHFKKPFTCPGTPAACCCPSWRSS